MSTKATKPFSFSNKSKRLPREKNKAQDRLNPIQERQPVWRAQCIAVSELFRTHKLLDKSLFSSSPLINEAFRIFVRDERAYTVPKLPLVHPARIICARGFALT